MDWCSSHGTTSGTLRTGFRALAYTSVLAATHTRLRSFTRVVSFCSYEDLFIHIIMMYVIGDRDMVSCLSARSSELGRVPMICPNWRHTNGLAIVGSISSNDLQSLPHALLFADSLHDSKFLHKGG